MTKQTYLYDFRNKWSRRLETVKSILKLVNLYPIRLELIDIDTFVSHDKLETNHEEWLTLREKFHPIEKIYFNPYLVPINAESYKCFIDLSNEVLPIIQPYYSHRRNEWCHWTRFETVLDLINFLDSDEVVLPPFDRKAKEKIQSLISKLPLDEIYQNYLRNKNG